MGGLRQFHLDGMDAGFRLPVMPGRPAALEAAVEDAGVTLGRSGDVDRRLLDGRRAGPAHVRADVEVRQLALEQERDMRADRVAVVEDGDAVHGLDPLDLGRKGGVIGRMEFAQPRRRCRPRSAPRPSFQIGSPSKSVSGIKPGGVLAGIEADAGGIAVGIDHVAVEGGAHRRRLGQQAVIELVNVPVGIGEQPAVVVEAVPDLGRHLGAGMRKAEDDGRGACA